jgi:hypothetical protein
VSQILQGQPGIPELPIVTAERLTQAIVHFMSEEISIEEAAARKAISDTSLRTRINNDPIYSKSVMIRGHKKDDSPIVKTNMRLQWLAEDEEARSTGEYLVKQNQKFRK